LPEVISAGEPGSRRSRISPFVVMDVMRAANERAASGADVIHMEVGQPGTPAPRVVREAVKAAVDAELLGYTEALGIPALRERIARHYRDAYGVEVSPAEVIVTAGSSAGFVLAFLAVMDEGDRLVMPEPGYPCYRNIAQAFGIEPVALPVGDAERWMPTSAALGRLFEEGICPAPCCSPAPQTRPGRPSAGRRWRPFAPHATRAACASSPTRSITA
jgi:aspartate/methionine/tyrosine aminotransferase